MISPKKVQDIVEHHLMYGGSTLSAETRTYELSMGCLDESRMERYIKDNLARELGRHLIGKSIVEHTKDPRDFADVYTGRVLVIPYLELEQTIAAIAANITGEIYGNDLDLLTTSWVQPRAS